MSVLTLNVDEVMRTLSAESSNPFVVHDKEVDIVRFAINSGFADIVLDGQVALRVMYQRPGETEVRAQTLTYYDTDGLHNYYDWQLAQSDLAKNGSLMVALCILDISGGEVSEWHTTPCEVRVLSTIHTDDSDEGDDTITPTVKERVAVLESMIQRVASGAPIVVSSVSAMTDTEQIYVLSTDGKWYYHNGTTWVSGGTYGAVATDTTLTQSGVPADAKAAGDGITDLKADLNEQLDTGVVQTTKQITWINAYVSKKGIVSSSMQSITGLVELVAGESVKVGTRNTDITIIGYTTKDSIAIGDAITPIYTTSSTDQFEEYSYTVTTNIKIVVSVKASDYSLAFYKLSETHRALNEVTSNVNSIRGSKVPALFEGGISSTNGQYYHDSNESWLKTRVRTNVVYIKKGAKLVNQSGNIYQLTICRYADFELTNYIETLVSGERMSSWICQTDGYYTITFSRSGSTIVINNVLADWNFNEFYCNIDERIHVSWIGSGNLDESTVATDSGDCTMFVFPTGEGLLVDSGNGRNYATIRKRLAECGFYHIKNIIISHFHDDHVGGLLQMSKSGYIDIEGATVYLPDYESTLWAYNNGIMTDATKQYYDDVMTLLDNKNCTLVYPDVDFKPYEIGGAVLSFFNTDLSAYENVSTNYNDWSLCNYIFYGNVNVCMTGDIGPIAENKLGGKLYKANIYKADHHGWLNQTTIPANYINNVSPDVIIALDGQIHDSLLTQDTAPLIRWAEKNGVAYYRKYENNEIKMAISKNGWMFETKVKRYVLPTA